MNYPFRWNLWNEGHIREHGIDAADAEYVVNHPARGFPRSIGNNKALVQGQAESGRYIQVIYMFSPPRVVYVIHARPLGPREKRNLRRARP